MAADGPVKLVLRGIPPGLSLDSITAFLQEAGVPGLTFSYCVPAYEL